MELNQFRTPTKSDDLCLPFCLLLLFGHHTLHCRHIIYIIQNFTGFSYSCSPFIYFNDCTAVPSFWLLAVSAKNIASAHSLVITNCDKEADCLVISNTLSIWPFILAFTRMPCPYFRTIGIRALPPPARASP